MVPGVEDVTTLGSGHADPATVRTCSPLLTSAKPVTTAVTFSLLRYSVLAGSTRSAAPVRRASTSNVLTAYAGSKLSSVT